MTRSLEGKKVALAEGRQIEELAELLEKEGAVTLRCPMLNILDAPDPEPVVAWLRELIDGRFSLVVLLTGEGLRRLLGVAERAGLRDAVIAALATTRTVTRGPKPGRALREIGLTPSVTAEAPTTEGVIAALKREDLRDRTVGVQLYSPENQPLTDYLATAGATARMVLPYIYAPATDADHVAELIAAMAAGTVDAVVFTSSPQVDRLYEVAAARGLEETLKGGLERTKVAAVGPVVADNLRGRGAPVHICPEQGWVMKNLVQHIRRAFDS